MRWVLNETCGIELPLPARKTVDLEGRVEGWDKEGAERPAERFERIGGCCAPLQKAGGPNAFDTARGRLRAGRPAA